MSKNDSKTLGAAAFADSMAVGIAGPIAKELLQRDNATDWLLSAVVTYMVRKGIIEKSDFLSDLNSSLDGIEEYLLKDGNKESEISSTKAVFNALISDVEVIDIPKKS